MKYYISVKMAFGVDLYDVSGPYDSFEEAEADFDTQVMLWKDTLNEDEYLGIVSRDENFYGQSTNTDNSSNSSKDWRNEPNKSYKRTEEYARKEHSWARNSDESKNFFQKHWGILLVLLILISCSSFAYNRYSEYKKTIKVGVSSETLIGKEYSAVEKMLSDSGFTNIHLNTVEDLSIKDSSKEGIVTNVSIRGDNQFEETSKYPYDTEIEITYHLVKKIKASISSKDAKGLNYTDLEKQFRNAGFINIRIEAEYDLITGWITKEGSIESVSINGDTSFGENELYRPDDEILIKYHAFSKDN